MNKKTDLIQDIDNLLGTENKKKTVPEQITGQEAERRSRVGRRNSGDDRIRLSEQTMYTSLAIDKDLYAKLRQIATINNLPYKDLLNAAIKKYIQLYEAKYGPVTSPRESKITADSLI